MKPTDFKNDEIRIDGFPPGGTSLVNDADYDSAKFADAVVARRLGGFDAIELARRSPGKSSRRRARLSASSRGRRRHDARRRDLETMFQLVVPAR